MKRDLDTMISVMKGVKAPVGFAPTLTARRSRARLMKPGLVAAALIIGAAFALRPAPAEARGWASAVRATKSARVRHMRVTTRGRLLLEGWTGPGGFATLRYDAETGIVVGEYRSDRRRQYRFEDFTILPRRRAASPSAFDSGVVEDVAPSAIPTLSTFEGDLSLSQVLGSSGASRVPPPEGEEGVWYRVAGLNTQGGAKAGSRLVRVDAESRVTEIRLPGRGEVRKSYDYPGEAPTGIFVPCPQVRRVPVIDVERTRGEIARALRAAGRSRGKTVFRAAILDWEGRLYLFWTGDASVTAKVEGMPTGLAQSVLPHLAQFGSPARPGVSPVLGEPMTGVALLPKGKVGASLKVTLRGREGAKMTVESPIVRVSELSRFRDVLGFGVRIVTFGRRKVL